MIEENGDGLDLTHANKVAIYVDRAVRQCCATMRFRNVLCCSHLRWSSCFCGLFGLFWFALMAGAVHGTQDHRNQYLKASSYP